MRRFMTIILAVLYIGIFCACKEEEKSKQPLILYNQHETLDWNGYLSIAIENLSYDKSIPEGFSLDDIWGLNEDIAEKDGTLREHTYLIVTARFTCTERIPALFGYDGPENDDRIPFSLSFADQCIQSYNQQTEQFISSCELRAFVAIDQSIDHHGSIELDKGHHVRAKLLYIVKDTDLLTLDTLIVFTPEYGVFSVDHLKRLGYTQPHILLKGEYK